ncbi:hypothetical protein PM082_006334 [Marasmius tenuissimus]|nr:hypothetical protein PM082_006334 [Marasmius tenuissimus]
MKNSCSMPKALEFTEIGSEGFETRNITYSDIVKREIEGFEPKARIARIGTCGQNFNPPEAHEFLPCSI